MLKAMLTKEFLLVLRDRHALMALFVMPAVFILIMSLALKDAFNEERALISYSIENLDQSSESNKLLAILTESRLLNEQNATSDESVQFEMVIPQGFHRQFSDTDDQKVPIEIKAASDVKQHLLVLFKMQITTAFLQIQMGAIKAKLETNSSAGAQDRNTTHFDEKNILKVSYNALEADEMPNSTQQSVPSWIVFGMFFVIIPMSTIFISEQKQNTLFRLLAMNVSIPLLFAGKIVPYLLINQLQMWVMVLVGMFVVPLFGAEALTLEGSAGALILLSFALSLSAIGLSMLIAVVIDSVEQATTIGGIISILLGAIGGVMVPKFIMPDFMQTFSNVSPMSWGLEGFLDILLRREGFEAVFPEVIALTLFGVSLMTIAMLIFNIKVRRGL
ncbi:MAG: ABC transporter permease [Campylobacterota bacterium]|nr:ABC transporter permease [Campylobacterota bacterium]